MPAARVDRHDDALPVVLERAGEKVRVAERSGAEHDARRAGAHRVGDRIARAQPAPELNGQPDLGGDPLDVLEVNRRSGACSVEVDDVEPCPPAAAQRRAASSGSAYSVAWSNSPRTSRTARPSRMSIAG